MTVSPFTKLKKMLGKFHDESGIVDDVAKSIDSFDAAVLFMAVMYDLLQDVRDMVSVAESRLIELTPDEKRYGPAISIPGGGSIEFHGGRGSKVERYTDNRRVMGKFAYEIGRDVLSHYEVARIITVNGEDLSMNADLIVLAIANEVGEAVGALTPGFKNWRSGIAKKYGIDLKSMRETSEAPVTVTIRGRDRT